MEFEVGSILTGKVTGITKFGAFVQLAPGKSGLVHISEIANTFVSDVSQFLSVGQEVQVKIISIDQSGRLNLSIKQTQPAPARPTRQAPVRQAKPAADRQETVQVHTAAVSRARAVSAPAEGEVLTSSNDSAFEDKLKKFMQDADSKMSGVRIYSDNKRSSRRRK